MCEMKAGYANRNRVTYLLDKIRKVTDLVAREEGREAKIMTVGCGPAIELQKFVELDENSNHTVLTLVDFEKEALEHAKEKILELKILHSRNLKMYPRLFTILQLIKDFKRGKEIFEKQDLIYCSGLFEYLNASTCKALIDLFYQYLNPGGQIIIGNFDEACAYRYFLEYCGEWYMVYRNEELMIDLASELKNTKAVFVEKEDTGYNDFLVINN
jgi:extracellular factor (EF) 3-hydroxypalmitic acid methyl ester biosynthesis protein